MQGAGGSAQRFAQQDSPAGVSSTALQHCCVASALTKCPSCRAAAAAEKAAGGGVRKSR